MSGITLRQVARCLMPQRIASAGFLMFRPKSCRPLERNHIRLVVNNATRIAGGIPFDTKIALAILCALFLMAKLTVNDLKNLNGQRVFLRVDYNVPMEEKDGRMVI